MRNGFQFLAGLVSLEMQRAESEVVLRVLRDLAARIRCLLLVDECLCGEGDGRPMDLGERLHKVWAAVSGIYPAPRSRPNSGSSRFWSRRGRPGPAAWCSPSS
jgi:two-component sensor histidine kinase